MLRSRHTIPLLVIALVVGAICVGVALLIDWVPAQAAEQAETVDNLTWFVIWVSVGIFTLVASVLLYCVWRFRAPADEDLDGPPTHGNTKLEVIWTVIPVALLAVVATWAYLVLSENEALAQDRLVVDVTAEQFAWTFTHTESGDPGTAVASSGDLRLPVGRQVELRMRSRDVIHSFYVVEFRVKQDVVPGITTRLIVDPTRTGTYQIICAELCGVGHGVMRSRVIVMEQDDYDAWLEDARRQAAQQPAPAQPESVTPPAGSQEGPPASIDAGDAPEAS